MGIDFQRHSRVGVTEKMLDLLDVHASLKAPGRIGVPQYMGRYLLIGQHKVASAFLWNHRTAATGNQFPQILERGVVVVRAVLPVENKEGGGTLFFSAQSRQKVEGNWNITSRGVRFQVIVETGFLGHDDEIAAHMNDRVFEVHSIPFQAEQLTTTETCF